MVEVGNKTEGDRPKEVGRKREGGRQTERGSRDKEK